MKKPTFGCHVFLKIMANGVKYFLALLELIWFYIHMIIFIKFNINFTFENYM
jgi:hypothetical protein